jgi:uroporphyrin-III C-methyltransferase
MKTAIFSLIIALSVAGLSLLQFEKYQKLSQTTQSSLTQLGKKLDSNLGDFNTELQKIKTQEQALLSHTISPSFQVAELEYLLLLANTRLETHRDLPGSIQLLKKAQEKIIALNDPHLYPIQEALVLDLATLQSVSLLSTEELWLRITMLIEQLSNLAPRKTAEILTHSESSKETSPTTASLSAKTFSSLLSTWKKNFFDTLKFLQDLVKIRHTPEPIEGVLSQSQQALVQENLRLLLEQLRVSVLNSQEKIYRAALQEAQKNLIRYYQVSDPKVQEMQYNLQELANISLHSDLPRITALELLKTLR